MAESIDWPGAEPIEVVPVVVLSQIFPARPSSIPDIRNFVRRCLAESPLTEEGTRAVGETVFRALLDAAGPTGSINVAFRIFPEHVEVDVLHSDSPLTPAGTVSPAGTTAPSGPGGPLGVVTAAGPGQAGSYGQAGGYGKAAGQGLQSGRAQPGGYGQPGGPGQAGGYGQAGGRAQGAGPGQAGGYGQAASSGQAGGYGQPGSHGQASSHGLPGDFGQPGDTRGFAHGGGAGQAGGYGQPSGAGGFADGDGAGQAGQWAASAAGLTSEPTGQSGGFDIGPSSPVMLGQPGQPATFAEWMQTALRREGLTQEAAARQLGVSVKTISRWVGGATEPRMRDLRRIQEVFGVLPLP